MQLKYLKILIVVGMSNFINAGFARVVERSKNQGNDVEAISKNTTCPINI